MAHDQKSAPAASARHRVDELDYLKGIMIILMMSFHLVYIGDTYPYAKQVVYTFHMPVFLILSGYLMNVAKLPRQFFSTMLWLAVPYAVMESAYTVAASLLHIREHIDSLTPAVFLDKLLVHPLGPYWYLHTLMLCGLTYYGVFRLRRVGLLSRYILMGLAFAAYAKAGLVSLPMSLYFLAGAVVRNSSLAFCQVFRASLLSWVAAGLLVVCSHNLHSDTAAGVLLVYLVISACLAVYPHLPRRIVRMLLLMGRNTLPLFLFSPIFTILCKPLVPMLSFDPTGMLFLVISLMVCTLGSLGISKAMHLCRLSPYFFGPDR